MGFWRRTSEQNERIAKWMTDMVLEKAKKVPGFAKLLENDEVRQSFYKTYFAFIKRTYAPMMALKVTSPTLTPDIKRKLEPGVNKIVGKLGTPQAIKSFKLALKKLTKHKRKAEKLKKEADKEAKNTT